MTWTTAIAIATLAASALALGCNGDDTNAPVPPVTVTDVSPASGPIAGGTSVTITGTNFTNVTSVTVGGGELGNRIVVSATQITGTVPASSSGGPKDVVVTSSTAGSGTCSGCFTYTEVSALIFAAVGAGNRHTCGLTGEGVAYCWGSSHSGELGNGTLTTSTQPVPVSGSLTFTDLGVGASTNCAVTAGGDAYCWGFNAEAELGIGTTDTPERCLIGMFPCSSVPVLVVGDLSFATMGHGVTNSHNCGLTTDAAAYCWGWNPYGQLGDGTTTGNETCFSGFGVQPCSTIPVPVAGGLRYVSVSTGAGHTCGLTTGGIAYCWGQNADGQLGDGTTIDRTSPVPVAGGLTFTTLSAGFGHSCGIAGSGTAYCWGANTHGKLGDGSPDATIRSTPRRVAGDARFATVRAGGHSTCALTSAGDAYCWGFNGSGQLGNGSTANESTPVPVAGELSFTSISLGGGEGHACALTASGDVYCWGSNGFGELGDGTTNNSTVPVRVASDQ